MTNYRELILERLQSTFDEQELHLLEEELDAILDQYNNHHRNPKELGKAAVEFYSKLQRFVRMNPAARDNPILRRIALRLCRDAFGVHDSPSLSNVEYRRSLTKRIDALETGSHVGNYYGIKYFSRGPRGLVSPVKKDTFDPNQPATCEGSQICRALARDELQLLLDSENPESIYAGVVPQYTCTCGYYAYNIDHGKKYKFDRDYRSISDVTAVVRAEGKIIEHEIGFRAQYLKPVLLLTNDTYAHRYLAARYGCEVRVEGDFDYQSYVTSLTQIPFRELTL